MFISYKYVYEFDLVTLKFLLYYPDIWQLK